MTGHSNASKRDAVSAAPDSDTSPSADSPSDVSLNNAPSPDNDPRSEESIGPLLARANLLRMRGQWDEAVATCTEALRKVPESPTACSLLGDIYEAQGKLDDALQWYGMAVEFNPSNKSDQAKLERIVQIQRQALLKEEKDAQERVRQAPPKKAVAAERTMEWLDRIFPPGKQEGIARLIIVIGVIIFVLLVTTASVVYFSQSQRHTTTPQLPPSPAAPEAIIAPTPPPRQAAPEGSEGPAQPAQAPAPASPPAASSGSGATPRPAAAAPAGNPRAIDAIVRGVPSGVTLISAGTDEHGVHLSLEMALPQIPSEAPAATRDRILRTATVAVGAASTAVPSLESAHVRMYLTSAPVQGNATPAPQIAFEGETASTAARLLDPLTLSEAQLRGLYTRSQWFLRSLAPRTNG